VTVSGLPGVAQGNVIRTEIREIGRETYKTPVTYTNNHITVGLLDLYDIGLYDVLRSLVETLELYMRMDLKTPAILDNANVVRRFEAYMSYGESVTNYGESVSNGIVWSAKYFRNDYCSDANDRDANGYNCQRCPSDGFSSQFVTSVDANTPSYTVANHRNEYDIACADDWNPKGDWGLVDWFWTKSAHYQSQSYKNNDDLTKWAISVRCGSNIDNIETIDGVDFCFQSDTNRQTNVQVRCDLCSTSDSLPLSDAYDYKYEFRRSSAQFVFTYFIGPHADPESKFVRFTFGPFEEVEVQSTRDEELYDHKDLAAKVQTEYFL